jgi:hypothetical protein
MYADVHDDQSQSVLPQRLPAQSQTLDGYHKFNDSSGPLFSMYSEIAEGEDNAMIKRWQKDAEGILIYVRLHVVIPSFILIN